VAKNPNIHTKHPLRVLIAGGGIGGLSAAIALRRHGHDVTVLDRAPELVPAGAGITLFANAMDALARLGVADTVAAAGAPVTRSSILTSDGSELTSLPADLVDGAVAVHRGELQAALLDRAGPIRLGVEIASVEQSRDAVVVRAVDGTEQHGDLLVGADGLRSVVRDAVHPTTLRYAGYTAWRGVSPVAVEAGRLSESWGRRERFGLGDIGSGTYWYATAPAPEGEGDDPREEKARLLERYSNWHTPIAEVLEATPAHALLRNDVYFVEPLPHWSDGRIVLLGDAAHATTPAIGQGAAQAIEDAVVLAAELARHPRLGDALAAYESIRRPRAELTLEISRRIDRAAQLANPVGRRLRNYLVRHTPEQAQRRQLGPLIQHRLA
jgi:2-polyprenyl-6-methoxyphenol hydroxylase-like FAD-dependent oxidoreductase